MSGEETFSLAVLFASNKKDSSAIKNQGYEEKVEEIQERSPLQEESIQHDEFYNRDVSPFNEEEAESEEIKASQAEEEPRLEEVEC